MYALIVEPPALLTRVRRGLGDPLAVFMVSVLVAFTGIGLFFTQIPVFMRKELGMDDPTVFATLSVHSATSTLSFAFIHRLVEALGAGRSLALALTVRSAAFILPGYVAAVSPTLLPLVFLVTGFTWAAISVSMNTAVVELSEEERRGERMGQLTAVTGVGLLLGSLVSGYIVSALGFTADFAAASSLELAAALLALYVARKARV